MKSAPSADPLHTVAKYRSIGLSFGPRLASSTKYATDATAELIDMDLVNSQSIFHSAHPQQTSSSPFAVDTTTQRLEPRHFAGSASRHRK